MKDRLVELLKYFELQARVFHTGELCNSSSLYGGDQLGYIHVVKQGSVLVEAQGHASVQIDKPTVFFYMRSTPHRLTPMQPQTESICASLDFGAGLSNPLVLALPDVMMIPLGDMPELDLALQLLFKEAHEQHCGRDAMLNRLMEIIFIHILRDAMDQQRLQVGLLAGLADQRLAKAINTIHEQPARNWSLEDLAQEAGMSRSNFAARFHEVVGMTPAYYLGEWRITIAQSLLLQGKRVQWISDRVGYANASALSRAFRTHRRESPKAWLRRHRDVG